MDALLGGGVDGVCGWIKGIDRPAICSWYPNLNGGVSMLVDAGANAECKARNLLEFAFMGSVYMEKVLGRKSPKVGLANIGAEAEKGNTIVKKAYELLSESDLNFTGNIEARDFTTGKCDIIVADGFTGNIILKLSEGIIMHMMKILAGDIPAEMALKIKKLSDYSEYGGAPILGVSRPIIKMHGSSGPKAVMNGILRAGEYARQNVVGIIAGQLK